MTTETGKKKETGGSKTTFKCKYCEEINPFEEMVIVTEYMPAIVVCSKCAKNIRR